MADERLREVERLAIHGDEAALQAWTNELRRLGLAFEECDACWGKGWLRLGAMGVHRCGWCEDGHPKIREESVYTLSVHGRPLALPPGVPRRRPATGEGHWGARSREVISRVMSEAPLAGASALKILLRNAYPFGERKYHPYKVWCGLVRQALDSRR